MSKLWTWFQEEIPPNLRPFLRPYTIMCVGGDAGLVECLPDVKSVSEVKKETDGFTTLLDFFHRAFHPVHPSIIPSGDTVSFEKARDNFLRSLVGYSVVCYILQIKDRHNANILMDREGHIMVSLRKLCFSCTIAITHSHALLFCSILTLALSSERRRRWVKCHYSANELHLSYLQSSGK
jgi:hypothetical protein